MTEPGVWTSRAAWLALPLAAGPALAAAFDARSAGVQGVASLLLWAGWAGGLLALLVPRTVTLPAIRCLAPAAAAAGLWAATAGAPSDAPVWRGGLAVAVAMLAAAAVFSPFTGDAFVNGSSYGPERRVALRVPGSLLLGPLELAWIVVAAGVTAGPLLLGARQWVAGAAALVIGLPAAWAAVRSLHGLSRRWLVFVPGGVVLHDPYGLSDPILFPTAMVASVGPAPVDTDAVDLTQKARGLALQLDATEPVPIGVRAGRRVVELDEVQHLLFTPTRPGATLAEAAERRLPVRVPA